MDWQSFDADPDLDPNLYFAANPDPDRHSISFLNFFIFLISVKDVIIRSILDRILKLYGKHIYSGLKWIRIRI